MYKFPSGLKTAAAISFVVGLVLFIMGVFQSNGVVADIKAKGLESEVAKHHKEMSEARAKEAIANNEKAPIVFEDHSKEAQAKEVEHLIHQAENRPWAAIYIVAFMFLGISLASLFFLAIQHASSSGWSMVVVRVMEGIASYLPVGGLIFFVILVLSGMHFNHLFHWMDGSLTHKYMIMNGDDIKYVDEIAKGAVANPYYDSILGGKTAFLNVPFWLGRAAVFIGLWVFFLYKLTSLSAALDKKPGDKKTWFSLRNNSAAFLVVFAVTSSIIAWDWLMSFDPHWFSTLYGWYSFSSYLTCAIATILLVSLYLRHIGVFPQFRSDHQHDLTKFLFGFSMLWTYLWFSQFMLIWYANIPEEVTYYYARFAEHKYLFLGMLIPNFVLPLLVLVSSVVKRKPKVVAIMSVIIILGHYIDFFVMLEPAATGASSSIGLPEIGAFCMFLGIFIFTVFTALTKRKAQHTGSPYYHESEIFHYPF